MFEGLGSYGVWRHGDQLTPELAAGLEELGYGTIWIGGSPDGDLRLVDELLDATSTITVATGIINIWKDEPQPVAESYHRIEASHPGRFLLGIGAGHRAQTPNTSSRTPLSCATWTSSTRPGCQPIDGCWQRSGRGCYS